jgi:PAS domain S-box-containing protein
MRSEVDPKFNFRRLSQEDTHFIIKYMQPAEQNAKAIGLDITFSADRAEAMRQARDTGSPRLTPPIELVQADESRIGSVLFKPIYAATPASDQRGEFLGWINAAFVAQDLLSDLTSSQGAGFDLWAYDGTSGEDGIPLYAGNRDVAAQPKFTRTHQIEHFGRTWTLEFVSTRQFEAALQTYRPFSILIAGLIMTILLVSILQNIRQRSETLNEISEFKNRQIEEREQENRSIVENDVTSVFLLEASDRILFANQAAQRCFGRTAGEMHMANFATMVEEAHPSDGSYNAKGKTKSGSELELDLQRNEWLSGTGEKRSTVILRDLSSQNTAQRALKQSKTLFDMALEGSEIGVFDVDLKTGKSDVSDTWCRIMGYAPGCNGIDTQKSFIDRIHPDDVAILEQADADCFSGKTSRSIAEYRLKNKDGSWCWMRSDAVVSERDAHGNALRLIGTQTDVTELRHNRNALENSERRFRQVVEYAPIGMALMDDTGSFVDVNSAFSKIAGRSEADLTNGLRLADLIPYDDRKGMYAAVSKLMSEKKGAVYSAEHRISMLDGDDRWGDFNVSWSFDKNENRYFFIAQIIDITDKKKIEKMKDEFVSTVSHELRTPLTSIKGALGLLTAMTANGLTSAQSRLIDIAKSNADRLTDIVNDILDLEKISSGEVTFNNAEFDLEDIIKASVHQMSPFAATHSCTIAVEIHGPSLPVNVDYGRTQQVLANLISNACKYSDPDSQVLVKAEMIDDQAIVYVQNFGSGVPDSFRSKIFMPFSQADSSDTRATGGTGLGLNITRQIVLRQGGKIGYESVRDGITVFWFTIPISTRALVVDRIAKSSPHHRERLAILHVEDDHDFAEVLAAALTDFADVQHARSLATAKILIASEHLDVVILDWTLPDGNASALIEEIKRRHPEASIIGLSANSRQENDPRLSANIVKSHSEMAAVVASINKCLPIVA